MRWAHWAHSNATKSPKLARILGEVEVDKCWMMEMKTDQNASIALGEVDSERVEIAMPPEGTGDRGGDGNGGYCGIQ